MRLHHSIRIRLLLQRQILLLLIPHLLILSLLVILLHHRFGEHTFQLLILKPLPMLILHLPPLILPPLIARIHYPLHLPIMLEQTLDINRRVQRPNTRQRLLLPVQIRHQSPR